MNRTQKDDWQRAGLALVACLMLPGLFAPASARAAEETNVRVVVKDAASEEPIFQAHLTLQFQEPRKLKRDKWISFSAKTDKNGRCTFRHIPMGTVRLMVTAERHQSYGKEIEIEAENPIIDVKLRKPQPQI